MFNKITQAFGSSFREKLSAHLRLGRYDKPIGGMLIYMPCVWGVVLGQPQFNASELMWLSGVFGVGAFSQRAAGCIVNDMLDQDIDKQVERTKTRPLASGELTRNDALISLGLHLSVGLGVLSQLPLSSVIASFMIVPVAGLYPLAKRYFRYPQLVLGINFNWGIFVGALASGGVITTPVLLCYLSGVIHTLIYDTVYAHQDADQDKLLNLYSTAYTLPENLPRLLVIPLAGLLGGVCLTAGMPLYTYLNTASILTLLSLDLNQTNFKDRDQCAKFFNRYQFYYLAISLTFLMGTYGIAYEKKKQNQQT